jgi:Secretion system C-terminal sorting domain
MKFLTSNLHFVCAAMLLASSFNAANAQNFNQKTLIGYVTNQQIPVFLERQSDTIIDDETQWRADISIGDEASPAQNLHNFTLTLQNTNQASNDGIEVIYKTDSWFGSNTQVSATSQNASTIISISRLSPSGASGTGKVARISGGGGIGENIQGRASNSNANSSNDIFKIFDIQTSGNEGIASNTVIYPNPSTAGETLNIFIPNEAASMQVQDITGKIVASQNVTANGSSISTENWAAGVYFIHLDFVDRKEIKRLVIK